MIRTSRRFFLIQFLMTVLFLGTVSYLAADTISWPVTVAVPTGMAGDLNSKPVSVSVPTGFEGAVMTMPVSVAVPSGFEGGVMTRPVSVALPVSAADGTYMGRPATVAFQPEKSGDPDLVGLWHMDGEWGDSSGNNNHGNPVNGPSFSSDRKTGTQSGSFNGNYLEGASSGVNFPAGNSPRTIEAWIKIADTAGADRNIFHYGTANSSPGSNIHLAVTGAGALWLGNGYGFGGTDSGIIVDDNNWHHVVGVYEGSGTNLLRTYVDGVPGNSGTPSTMPNTGTGSKWRIGVFMAGGTPINGLVDEVAIYRRALTAEEIALHFATGMTDPAAPASPILNPVPSVVGTNTITLSGARPPGTSIWVNNKRVAAFENMSSWQGSYGTLQQGPNILNVTALDTANRVSQPVTRNVYFDSVPPFIENSIPANGAITARVVSSVTINLYDANAGVDLAGSIQGATVNNAAGQTIAGAWTASGTKTIVFTPANPFPQDTYTVAISPVDAVGNRTAQAQLIVFTNHDISQPVTGVALGGTKNSAGWFSTAVTATLIADDGIEGAGIERIEYSLDDGATWQSYSTPIILDKEGRTTLRFRAVDKAGNIETPAKSQEVKINKTGLVGLWRMDGEWTDVSLIRNDGLPYGGASFSPDAKMGTNSALFDGSNDGIKITDLPEYQAIKNISVEAWIKPQRITSGVRQTIVSFKEGDSPNVGALLALPEDATNKVRFWVKVNDVWQSATSAQTIAANADWYHVVGTYDGSVIKVYVNGSVTATIAPGMMANAPGSATSTVTIGARASNNTHWYQGLIDEVAIYNRALTDIEVQEHYRNLSIGVPTVEAITSPTNIETITLRGTKPANMAIVVSGTTVVPLDANTAWEGNYTLKPGMNNISVTAMDADGYHSQPVTLSVALDVTAPAVTATNPVNGGLFNNDITSLSFSLSDAFTAIDEVATLAGAMVKSVSGFDVSGVWNSTGSGATRTFIFSPSNAMSEGTYTATITPTDSFGNTAVATLSFTVDTTPPPVPTIDDQSAPIRFTSKTITGTKSTDAFRVMVVCPGATAGTVSYPTNTTWSVNVSGLKEGGNSVSAYAEDAAGNPSGSVSTVITVDLTPPAKPTVASFTSPTKETTVTLTGGKEADTWLFFNNQQIDVPFSSATWSRTVSLAEGGNTFTLFAKDAAGNQGASASVAVVRDTAPPALVSSTPVVNAVTNTADGISATFADIHAGADLAASLTGAVVKNAGGAVIAGSWSVSGAALVFTPQAPIPEGAYTVTLYPVDTLGNKGSAAFSFTLDRTLPAVQSFALSPASPVKAGTATFTLAFSETMTTSVQPAVTFSRGVFSGTYTLTGSWIDARTWRGSYALTADTGDGTYSVTVSGAKDLAGNVMSSQPAGTFVLVTALPATPAIGQTTTPTKVASQTLSGAKPADTALVINNAVRVPLNSATTWSYSYPLAEGPNSLTIVARDAAGNDSLPIAPAPVVTLDTTPPQFTIDTFKSPSPTVNQTIGGKKEPGCIVKLNGTTIFDATDQNATWSYPITLIDGISNHLIFTASDGLGNTTTKTLDILCDTAPPSSLAAGMLVADGSGKGTEVALSWPSYVETSGLGYYRIYSGVADYTSVAGLTPVGTVSKGTRSFKVSGLAQGSRYWFAVVPVSVSGNADPAVHTASAIPTDTVAPEEVTGLAAWAGYKAADGNYVTLSWVSSVNTLGDLAEQMVYVDGGQGYDSGAPIGKTATTYTKKGLADATNYKFKVTTKDTLGHESTGAVVTAVTRLANPAGLAGTPGNGKVTLTWNAVASPYVKLYNVYRLQSANQQTDALAMTLVKSQTTTSFTDTGLVNGTTYQYAVTTLSSSGAERTDVQSVSAAPRGDTTGPVISNVSIAPNQVITAPMTISASAVDANDSTNHPESAMSRIELWIDGVMAATQNGSALSYAWNVVDTTDGNHTVRIAAYDAPGNLTEQIIPVVVSLAPPAAPVITSTFSGPINVNTATISGTAQVGSTITLRVNGVVVSSVSAATSNFSFPAVPLAEGINSVAVKAGNRGGDSPFCADTKITVVTTAPAAPLNLVAKPLAGGSVQFSWQAGGSGAVGYNLYEGTTSLGGVNESGVHKTNSAPIPYLLKEYIPADDTPHFYTVTAIDGAGNESPISNVVSIAADRAVPTVADVQFTQNSTLITQNSPVGPGQVQVAVTVSEALSETPFFSLEPQNASPVIVSLRKSDDTHYAGSITLDATSPHGPTTWKFSGKDLVGNRGNSQGAGLTIDVKGPVATVAAPLILLKTTTGPVSVALVFDEPSTTMPTITLRDSDGGTVQVAGLTSTDSGLNWSGTLDPAAFAEGSAQFLLSGARDRFGNIGTTVKNGGSILLYKTNPPASAVPSGLAAKPGKGGTVALSWTKVADAQGYNVYRQGAGDSAPLLINSISTGATVTYNDTPAVDGSYSYSVSSLGLLGVESAQSGQVSAVSDRTPPPVPVGLALALSGNGVQASWDVVAAPAEIPALYRLFRSGSVITDVAGLTPLLMAKSTPATDSSPTKSLRFYAVTALDALGNESPLSPTQEITFPVAPVGNLTLTLVDDGKPALSWTSGEANVQGFYIYRNGNKINQAPTISTTYSDGYYSSGSVTYGVSAVDATGTESPVKEVMLPSLTIALKDGTVMHRGALETITLMASLPSPQVGEGQGEGAVIDAVTVKIGTLPESTGNGPFTVIPGTPLEIKKVAATEANAPPQEAVVVTAVMHPAPGTTVKLTKSSLASVLGSGTALEIFNEPLVRGTRASVRIKVNNLGSARSEFLTSENGGATSHVTVYLKDQDGNLLAQGNLSQRTGAVVNSGSYATARLEPGESFLSDPITFTVPATAPYKVSLEAVIDNNYFHYQQDDQVVAPGLKQSVETTIADVSYTAQATTDKSIYKQGESIVISGQTISTTSGQQMPLVPVKIGVSVKGFDRFFTVNTDQSGAFSYTFTPASNEAGRYSVWAMHPDLSGRSVQAQFNIIGLQVSPLLANLTTTRGRAVEVPVTLRNLADTALTGLTLTPSSSSGITATVVNGGSDRLAGGETRIVAFRLTPDVSAPDTGFASLAIATAEGLAEKVDANVTLVSAIPVIKTSPSYIDTGIVRGSQKIATFTISNAGIETLRNARIEGPSLPWMSLTVDKPIGNIEVGSSREVGILLKPAETVPQGIFDDRVVIYSDNHIPYTYNIQVTVTSSAVGSVRFNVIDSLLKKVGGANITLQHQTVPDLYYSLATASDGTVAVTDIPEGRYTYNASAAGHKPFGGSFVITPGIWTNVPVALEVTLVQIEWSVTPVIIEDRYEITVKQTFETNVPTPVIVTEPPGMALPRLQPGQVFNGEFTITNYGLISADFKGARFPSSFGDYDLELLANIPSRLNSMQKITIPYKVTRRQQTASLPSGTSSVAALYEDVKGFGGSGCSGAASISTGWGYIICPSTDSERSGSSSSDHTITYDDCATSGSSSTSAGGAPSPPPPSVYYGGGGSSYRMDTGSGIGVGTPLPDTVVVCIIPIPCEGPECDDPPDPDDPAGPDDTDSPDDPTSPDDDPPDSDPPGPPAPDSPGPEPSAPTGPPGDPTPPTSPDPPFPTGDSPGPRCS